MERERAFGPAQYLGQRRVNATGEELRDGPRLDGALADEERSQRLDRLAIAQAGARQMNDSRFDLLITLASISA